ncbi:MULTISPECIES: chromate transporter [Helcococcus]|uniref:Chromate transporter n=1 Tax=Helcococcus bovis TaxID=3153252 RepID=A0ABW9F5S5_9FIRM
MKKKDFSIFEMFIIFLKISSFTFGGGYTIVPVIKDEFSIKRNLISKHEMMDIVSISTSGPGPMAINCSILTGYRLFNLKGAIMAAIAATLPSLAIITLISYFYKEFSQNFYVKSALLGMGGMIAAILLFTTYEMAKQALKTNLIFGILIMISAFIASFIFKINTGLIILFVGLLGITVFSIVEEDKIP